MVELESRGEMSRHEVAAFLRKFIEELEEPPSGTGVEPDRPPRDPDDRDGESPADAKQMTFVVGGDSATVTIPETVEFDVEVESRSPLLKSNVNQEVSFELSWEIAEPRGDDSVDLM